jgi:hypothetical protein
MAKRKARQMKTRAAALRDAMARGITSVGGLARAVYGAAPRNRRARLMAAKLRYYALHTSETQERSASR